MEPNRVEANGVDFAYLEAGPPDGPLVLCMHGFPDHAPTFEGLLGDLGRAGFRAVAPWMRGYAPTSVPADGRYGTAHLALDALALTDALAPDTEAVLVGHDWGAPAVYLAATHRPERVRRVVGLAVPPGRAIAGRFLTDVAQLKRSWYMFFFQLPVAETAVQAGDYALIDELWRDWSPGYTPPEGFMRALKDTLASPGSLEAALGYYRAMWRGAPQDPEAADVQARGGGPVPVPALYMHGAEDGCMGSELIDPDAVRACFSAGAEVDIVPDAGHFLHLERPEVVNARIVSALGG